jgi:hypothetical protein
LIGRFLICSVGRHHMTPYRTYANAWLRGRDNPG